jgi:hypothetical protein
VKGVNQTDPFRCSPAVPAVPCTVPYVPGRRQMRSAPLQIRAFAVPVITGSAEAITVSRTSPIARAAGRRADHHAPGVENWPPRVAVCANGRIRLGHGDSWQDMDQLVGFGSLPHPECLVIALEERDDRCVVENAGLDHAAGLP